eukprot:4113209-Pyramimonas_sp.AAC.1
MELPFSMSRLFGVARLASSRETGAPLALPMRASARSRRVRQGDPPKRTGPSSAEPSTGGRASPRLWCSGRGPTRRTPESAAGWPSRRTRQPRPARA